MSDDCCVICNGDGKNMFNETCTYCNGTGEPNNLAEEYIRNHICQCKNWDRKFCPVCKKECHHDTSLAPTQKIDPGYGGMTATITIQSNSSVTTTGSTQEIEELIMT